MTSYTIQLFVFSIALFSIPCSSALQSTNPKPHPYSLPVKKDQATHVFYTSFGIGTPRHNFDLAIDLSGENLWYDCDNNYYSSSFSPISCNSHSCPKTTHPCSVCYGPFKPGCTNNTCGTDNYNPFANVIFRGNLAKDVIFISQTLVPNFLSGCTNSNKYPDILNVNTRLPKSSKGVLGLARSQLAVPTQLALLKKLPHKFSLCLPSSNKLGFINLLIGPKEHPQDVSKYDQATPLVLNPVDTGLTFEKGAPSREYFINVTSIKIDGHVVNLNPSVFAIDKKGHGGTKISTVTRFTQLESFIFRNFLSDFLKKAAKRRLKRVASVYPFEACFDSKSIGFAMPTIDLVLQGGVQWTIQGANSIVMAKENVACLAIVDGGELTATSSSAFLKASIVIGTHQLEENLLVFDLASSKLSFSSLPLNHNATCSHF